MYKNTVLLDQPEERTLVRVRGAGEGEPEVEEAVRELTRKGVKTLVFPSEEMLTAWRLRLAALA